MPKKVAVVLFVILAAVAGCGGRGGNDNAKNEKPKQEEPKKAESGPCEELGKGGLVEPEKVTDETGAETETYKVADCTKAARKKIEAADTVEKFDDNLWNQGKLDKVVKAAAAANARGKFAGQLMTFLDSVKCTNPDCPNKIVAFNPNPDATELESNRLTRGVTGTGLASDHGWHAKYQVSSVVTVACTKLK